MDEIIELIDKYWRFDNNQQPMSSWHEKQDLIELLRSKQTGTNTLVSGSLLSDWQKWEDCILSFLRTYPKVREDFNKHVDEWNTHTPLPASAYERTEQ